MVCSHRLAAFPYADAVVVLRDGPAALQLVWFNQLGYFRTRFQEGRRLLVHGRVDAALGGGPLRMTHPDVTMLDADDEPGTRAGLMAVYEKPTPWPVSAMRRIVHGAVADFADRVPAGIPAPIAARQRLLDPARALRYVHEPPPTAEGTMCTWSGRNWRMRAISSRSM